MFGDTFHTILVCVTMSECVSANVLTKNEFSRDSNNIAVGTNNDNNNNSICDNENSNVTQHEKNHQANDEMDEEESSKFQENKVILERKNDTELNLSNSGRRKKESLKTVQESDYEKYFAGKVNSEKNLSSYDPDMVYAVCIASKEVARKKKKKQRQTSKRSSSKNHLSNILTNLFRRCRKNKCTDQEEDSGKSVNETELTKHDIKDKSFEQKEQLKQTQQQQEQGEEQQPQQQEQQPQQQQNQEQHHQQPIKNNYLTIPTAKYEPQVINNRSKSPPTPPAASVKDVEYDLINNCPLIWTRSNSIGGRKVSVSERHQDDRLMVASACRKYTQIQYINRKIF